MLVSDLLPLVILLGALGFLGGEYRLYRGIRTKLARDNKVVHYFCLLAAVPLIVFATVAISASLPEVPWAVHIALLIGGAALVIAVTAWRFILVRNVERGQ